MQGFLAGFTEKRDTREGKHTQHTETMNTKGILPMYFTLASRLILNGKGVGTETSAGTTCNKGFYLLTRGSRRSSVQCVSQTTQSRSRWH